MLKTITYKINQNRKYAYAKEASRHDANLLFRHLQYLLTSLQTKGKKQYCAWNWKTG